MERGSDASKIRHHCYTPSRDQSQTSQVVRLVSASFQAMRYPSVVIFCVRRLRRLKLKHLEVPIWQGGLLAPTLVTKGSRGRFLGECNDERSGVTIDSAYSRIDVFAFRIACTMSLHACHHNVNAASRQALPRWISSPPPSITLSDLNWFPSSPSKADISESSYTSRWPIAGDTHVRTATEEGSVMILLSRGYGGGTEVGESRQERLRRGW